MIDGWIKHKIRTILWKQWKTTKMRIRMQRKYAKRKITFANSRLGPYRTAKRQLHFSITDKVLREDFKLSGIIDNLEIIRNKKRELDLHCQLTLFKL